MLDETKLNKLINRLATIEIKSKGKNKRITELRKKLIKIQSTIQVKTIIPFDIENNIEGVYEYTVVKPTMPNREKIFNEINKEV